MCLSHSYFPSFFLSFSLPSFLLFFTSACQTALSYKGMFTETDVFSKKRSQALKSIHLS